MPARGNASGIRVFLIPGMDGSAKNFLSISTFRDWARGLADMGADVVVLNTPIPRPCWFSDGGTSYRAAYLHELDDVVAEAAARHGTAQRSLISGVSYGGIHALIGYAARPGLFVGWEAAMTVTKLSALEELGAVGEVAAFDPFNEVAWLQPASGFITWGGRDMRVDHWQTQRLNRLIKSPGIVAIGYPELGHQTTPQTVKDLLVDARRY